MKQLYTLHLFYNNFGYEEYFEYENINNKHKKIFLRQQTTGKIIISLYDKLINFNFFNIIRKCSVDSNFFKK